MAKKKKKQEIKRFDFPQIWKQFRRWVVLSIALTVLLYAGYDFLVFVVRSDLFMVREIRVEGHHALAKSEILQALEVDSRVRLWQLNPKALEGKLMDLNLIRSVRIRRMLPQTLVIEVSERSPLVDWTDSRSGTRYALDEEGVILAPVADLKRRSQSDPTLAHLNHRRPQIIGIETWGWIPGDTLREKDLPRLLKAYALAISRNEAWVSQATSFRRTDPAKGWTIQCQSTAEAVHLGTRDYVERLGRIGPVWRFLQDERIDVEYIDLRFENQGVVVRPLTHKPADWIKIAQRYSQVEMNQEGEPV